MVAFDGFIWNSSINDYFRTKRVLYCDCNALVCPCGFIVCSTTDTSIIEQIKSTKVLTSSMIVLFACSIIFCYAQIGKYKRNESTLTDIYKIKQIVPENSIVGYPSEMHSEWALKAYIMRYNKNSLMNNCSNCNYFIIYKNLNKNLVPPYYTKVNLETQSFDLYRLNKKF